MDRYKEWKKDIEISSPLIIKNLQAKELLEFLREAKFELGTNASYYYYGYSDSPTAEDTRRILYYRNIGMFKIIIKVYTHDICQIKFEKVRRAEKNMPRIQDYEESLGENWDELFRDWISLKDKNIKDIFDRIQDIKLKIDDYLDADDFANSDIPLELKRISLYDFKNIREATIDLEEDIQVLVGINNAGKSSLIQGIVLAYQSIFKMYQEKKIKSIKGRVQPTKGAIIQDFQFVVNNERELLNIESSDKTVNRRFAKFEFNSGQFIELDITIVGQNLVINFSKESYSSNISSEKFKQWVNNPIALIPSFFTVTLDEERKSKGRYNSLLKTGNYNRLFRNILLDLKEKDRIKEEREENEKGQQIEYSEGGFEKLCRLVNEIFGVEGLKIDFDEDKSEFIEVKYTIYSSNGKEVSMDISNLGMGTLQFIQVIAQVLNGEAKIILLDEPDAHLHAKLQVKIMEVFKQLSKDYGVKFMIATHSKDIINSVNPRQVITFHDGGVTRINKTNQFIDMLKIVGVTTEELIGSNIGKRIIIVEGQDDIKYIEAICKKFGVTEQENYNLINYIAYEGRQGVLYNQIEKLVPNDIDEFRKVAIFDRDYRYIEKQENDAKKLRKKGFEVIEWRKKELENYFLIDSIIINVINNKYPQAEPVQENQIVSIIEEYSDESFLEIKYEFMKEKVIKLEQECKRKLKKSEEIECEKFVIDYLKEANKRDIYSGKQLLDRIRTELIVRNTPSREEFIIEIINNLNNDDLHEDVEKLLESIKSMGQ